MARRNNRTETQVRPSPSDDEKNQIAETVVVVDDEADSVESPLKDYDNNMDTIAKSDATNNKSGMHGDGIPKKVRTKRSKSGVISQADFERSSEDESSESSDEFDIKTKKFRCSFCNRMFALKKALKKHKQRDHSPNPGSIPCDQCTRKFHYKWQLKRHTDQHHTKKKRQPKLNKCAECPKSFKTAELLSAHATEVHADLPFKCTHTDCQRTFNTNQKLRKHTLVDHQPALVYSCTICGMTVKTVEKLEKHEASHIKKSHQTVLALPPVVTHKCTKCPKEFRKRQLLLQHIRVHDKYPFTCQQCNRGCRTLNALKQHEEIHSMKYMCDMCELTFREIENLRDHELQMHAKEQPYKCPYCTEEFGTSIDWKEHISVHSAPTLACKHCSQKFETMSALVLHVQVHANAAPPSAIAKVVGRQETITRIAME